jgi:multisubunit Na+/H+ antiporter MnhB subunit
MSHRYFHTEPGWISALFALITQPVSGFVIGSGLILFGLASRHAPHRQRLAIAFAILAMAMLMSTISALMVVKEIVMFHRSHPAVHGSTWFTSLKIESW